MPRIVIDGKELEVKEGTTILEAARGAGIYIPSLCYDPDLKPYGACRLCVVEVEGREELVRSCMTPVEDGMVVHTNTERVRATRRRVLEIIKADHANNCQQCPKNERCELQEISRFVGVETFQADRLAWPATPDQSHPLINLDRRRCVLCARCVRTCEEIQGVGALEISGVGFSSMVAPKGGGLLGESPLCESCGQCVEHCPTAALLPKVFFVPTQEVRTVCPYCGTGCGIYLQIYYDRITGVRGDRESPVNRGNLCVKGRFGVADFIAHFDRLDAPLRRDNGGFTRISWEEALSLAAERLRSYRPEEVAVIASAKGTNEDNYVLQKFARAVLRTNNLDHCARLCHAPTVRALAEMLGSGAMTNSIPEVAEARCILAVGTNTTETHPVIGLGVRRAVREGAKLIVVNPKRIKLCDIATLWLPLRPGTDVALFNGMAKVILEEGLYDRRFVEERTEGFEELKKALAEVDLAEVERITGVSAELVAQAARLYATTQPAMTLYTMGLTQHACGTDNVRALTNLVLLTGNVGKRASGINPLRGQNNVQGACDMGCLPDLLPGYRSVADPQARRPFEEAWGCELSGQPGLSLTEIFEAAREGRIKALYIVGENPVLSDPDAAKVEEALRRVEFLVVQDLFRTETAEFAHLILPAASFAEKDGTFTSTDRRVQRVRKALDPLGQSRPDWQIVCDLARAMGAAGFDYGGPEQIMEEIARLVPQYGGISYRRLEEGGLQWPCPSPEHPGTPILHVERFPTPTGRARFVPVGYRPPAEQTDEEYPLVLITGRSLYHYHTGTMTRKTSGLNQLRGEELLEVNPEDAARLGISEGSAVRVSSRRGQVVLRATLSTGVPRGAVFMTFHFREARANLLTNPALDPLSKIPELKRCAVRVEPAAEEELPSFEGEASLDELFD